MAADVGRGVGRLVEMRWEPTPLVHEEIETRIVRGESDGYSQMGLRNLGACEEAE